MRRFVQLLDLILQYIFSEPTDKIMQLDSSQIIAANTRRPRIDIKVSDSYWPL